MGEVIFGLVLLTMGTVSALLTRRAHARGAKLMKIISPNKDHPGVMKYGRVSRTIYTVFCLILGVGFVIFGLVR